jgi:hypothetical protein
MRSALSRVWIAVICGLVCLSASQAAGPAGAAAYVGTWSGTWEGGGGTGTFELKLEGTGTAVAGSVNVGTDAGAYSAKFKSMAFDGNKMTAKYDYGLDTQAEIALTATFEGASAKGTWAMLPQGQEQVLVNGTWTVQKK